MQPFRIHKGLVAPMDRENVDTDAIIPKQFLKSIRRTGFGPNLFDEWRYLDPGSPGQDPASRKPNPDFVLNQPRYAGASILLARKNFGCGSSREHAPWALDQYGFRAIIAPSYADIFFNNCFKNGLLPIVLPEATVAKLFDQVSAFPGYELTIDLDKQVVTTPQGGPFFSGPTGQCHSRTSTNLPAIAAAAAIAGDTRWVRPLKPWRPSKLRFEVEAQRSPGSSLSGFMARHIEQPGSRQSKPAALKILSRPSCSACCFTKPEPGTIMA